MHAMMIAAFVGSGLLLFYVWFGYGLIVAVVSRRRPLAIRKQPADLKVSVIIAAKNEQNTIRQRLENLFELDYDPRALEIIVASDGSTDDTVRRVRDCQDNRCRVLEFPASRGRASVHNDAVKVASGEILVFTDAATRFDPGFLKALVANFADIRVGCVSGVINFDNKNTSDVTQQRSFYWRYEYWLRKQESRCGILACASGPCMAVRASLFLELKDRSYDVDFITPLDVLEAGSLVLQEEQALAVDQFFTTPGKEWQAQVRMVSRNLAGYIDRKCLMTSWRLTPFAWSLISHKVLRWATPVLQLVLLLSNIALAVEGVAVTFLALQVLFYAAAALGWILVRAKQRASILSVPFAFCLASCGFLFGILKCLRSERITVY